MFLQETKKKFTNNHTQTHFLNTDEINVLDTKVFSHIRSALVVRIYHIGEIMFLSNDPERYSPGTGAHFIQHAVEVL